MPIVLIVIGLAVAVGIGSYFLRPAETINNTEITTPINATNTINKNEEAPVAMPSSPSETQGDAIANEPVTETTSTVPDTTSNTPTPTPTPSTPTTPVPVVTTTYADGTHTITTSYNAPGSNTHTLTATITLKNDVVTGSVVTFGGDRDGESSQYQKRFLGSYESQVVGKKLADIRLSRVAGASLTTNSFNDAITKIKSAALN